MIYRNFYVHKSREGNEKGTKNGAEIVDTHKDINWRWHSFISQFSKCYNFWAFEIFFLHLYMVQSYWSCILSCSALAYAARMSQLMVSAFQLDTSLLKVMNSLGTFSIFHLIIGNHLGQVFASTEHTLYFSSFLWWFSHYSSFSSFSFDIC